MKKNKMMRLASILLVLVLMTSSVVGGTFAKYTTSASGTDSARVAKWGVDIEIISGKGFSNEYATHDKGYSGSLSVKSVDDEKVVAPGTSSADVNGDVTFKITGAPEVAVALKFDVVATNEIKLAAGDYLDYTTANNDVDKFTLDEEYYPVKFTLTKSGVADPLVENGTLEAVAATLNGEANKYAPNTTLDRTYTLTWAWAFNQNDKADTYLGNEATLQTLAYTLSITVEQID